MRSSILSLFAVLASLAASASPAGAQDPASLERSLRNLYLERRILFEDAWFEADADARGRARGLLRGRGAAGLPSLYSLSAMTLTEAYRQLADGTPPHERSPATRLAESLDLRVVPGAFSAGRAERGEEMIVRVLPAYTNALRGELPEELDLGLVWIAPDGAERRARREPVHRAAMRMPGFEMYFRAPASEPGRWWLVPEVTLGDDVGRGIPVAVDCIANLFPRYDAIPPTEGALRALLERVLVQGERDARYPDVSALLAPGAAERLAVHAPCAAVPEDPATFELAPPAGAEPADLKTSEIVVLLTPGLEDPEWALTGRAGAAWRSLAEEHGARVVVTGRPVRGLGEPDLLGLLASLRETWPDARLTVVTRGRQASELGIATYGTRDDLPFDRVVQDTVLFGEGAPRRTIPCATLLFEPFEEAHAVDVLAEDFVWVRHPDPPHLAALDLPATIGRWLAGELEGDDR